MKNITLIVLSFFSFLEILSAQGNTDLREKVTAGIKMGANYSNVYDASGEEFIADPKLGLALGGFLTIPIGKYLGVQPELLFSQRGFSSIGKIFGGPYTLKRTSNFIDLPVLFAFKPVQYITLLAGPQYSYLIKQSDVLTSGNLSYQQDVEFKNENLRKNILCFTGGADIHIQHFAFGVRAGWDLQTNKGDGTSSTPQYKNMWYQGTIAYRF